MNYVKHILFNRNAELYNFFDRKAIQRLVRDHMEGKINRRLFIWSLLNFEWWLRKFIEKSEDSSTYYPENDPFWTMLHRDDQRSLTAV